MVYNGTYDTSKETELKVKVMKKNNRGEYIQIKRLRNERNKSESIDIRTMYTTEYGELALTKKGIRINSEQVVDVVTSLIECLSKEEIIDIVTELNKRKVGYTLSCDITD